MKLSEHINHCTQMLGKFGDKDVVIMHRDGPDYDSQPRITGGRCYEISRAVKGQFTADDTLDNLFEWRRQEILYLTADGGIPFEIASSFSEGERRDWCSSLKKNLQR